MDMLNVAHAVRCRHHILRPLDTPPNSEHVCTVAQDPPPLVNPAVEVPPHRKFQMFPAPGIRMNVPLCERQKLTINVPNPECRHQMFIQCTGLRDQNSGKRIRSQDLWLTRDRSQVPLGRNASPTHCGKCWKCVAAEHTPTLPEGAGRVFLARAHPQYLPEGVVKVFL